MTLSPKVILAVLLIGAWACAASAQAPGRQTLHDHVPRGLDQLRSRGLLARDTNLDLSISLPLRNNEELQALLRDLANPASPQYRQYLTPEQFAERFGPSEADYQALIAFAESRGLLVVGTHPNRVILDLRGRVPAIENAFHVTLREYPHPREKRTFFALDTEPSIDLAVPILHINGLDNYVRPFPKAIRRSDGQSVVPHAGPPATGSGPSGWYWGGDFRRAYVPGTALTGSGQNVALFELDGYYTADITNYEVQAGLPNVPLVNVGSVTPGINGGIGEVSLDIEMVVSMAPGIAHLYVYEGTNPDTVLNKIATDNLAKQVSCSWGWTPSPDLTADGIFQQMAAQGQSFFNAVGDTNAFVAGTADNYAPTTSTNVTQVGGTTLTMTSGGNAYVSETVWNWNTEFGSAYDGMGSSGGVSSYYAMPSYQQGISMTANHGSTTMRNVPDVALTADGIWVIANNGAANGMYGGTSCAAPLWAAFTALVNQQAAQYGLAPVGFLNPALYALGKGTNFASCFHDITTGNNEWSLSPTNFIAVPGYDLCTGWGTPTGTSLINALATLPDPLVIQPSTVAFAGPVGGPFLPAPATLTLTNTGAATLYWVAGTTSSWLTISATNGTLPGGNATTVTVTPLLAAAALSAGNYQDSVWFTNQTTMAGQNCAVTLAAGQTLIQNGGFELNSFTGWTQSGNTARSSVSSSSSYVHSGTYGARMGPSTTMGYLSQTLATVAGGMYLLSCWRDNPGANSTPNEFSIAWNGGVLVDATNIATAAAWTNYQFLVTATGSSSAAQFGFRGNGGSSGRYFGFDDVSVVPVSPPVIAQQPTNQTVLAGGTVIFSVASWGSPTLQYQWQMNGTNLLNATHATLLLSGLATNQAGNCRVVVSNAYGSVTSSNAVLDVWAPPTALFTASPTNGMAPLIVTFSDLSGGTITNRFWNFDDGKSSNTQALALNHTYAAPGVYAPRLTVAGPAGASTNSLPYPLVVVVPPAMYFFIR